MIIVYRDEIGEAAVYVNEYGISFCEGYAYFSSNTRDYKVKIEHIQSIH